MYEFAKLKDFLEKSAKSENAEIVKISNFLLPQLQDGEDTEAKELNNSKEDESTIHNDEGKILETAFKELPTEKTASAYIKDVYYRDLPVSVQKDVQRFVSVRPKLEFVLYGMTIRELLNKVDLHNFEVAEKHIENEEVTKESILSKLKTKYILVINDTIVDGHHTIAKAKKAGITSSMNVLDLTPARFQKTAWDVLREKEAMVQNRSGVQEIVKSIVRKHSGSLVVYDSTSFNTLKLDSLDMAELIMALEERFNLNTNISNMELASVKTVKDAVDLICKKKNIK